MTKLTRQIICDTCEGEGECMQAKLYPNGHHEVIDTCPDCDGTGYITLKEKTMDVITLLQLDAGARLYECRYNSSDKASTYTFKTFDTYEVGDFAFVLPAGHGGKDYAEVVRIVGEGEFSESVEYKWLCGPCVLPDMKAGEALDASARRKIAIGQAIEAAKSSAAHMSKADYVPAPRLTNNEK